MKNMLKNLITWFIFFGLSFFVSGVLGWGEQRLAFFYIYLAITIIDLLLYIVIVISSSSYIEEDIDSTPITIWDHIGILWLIVALFASLLLVTWAVAELFKADFFVVFEIIILITGFIPFNRKRYSTSLV